MLTLKDLELAYDILAKIPSGKFVHNLGSFFGDYEQNPQTHPHNCDTLACAAGWLSLNLDFCEQAYGVRAVMMPPEMFVGDDDLQSARLFAHRDHGQADYDLEVASSLSDKQLALYRIRREMAESPEVALEKVIATEQRIA